MGLVFWYIVGYCAYVFTWLWVGDLLVVRGLWAYLLLCLFCLFVFANALGLVLNDLLWLLGGFVYFGCLLR